jgi:hypothetical protein
MTKISGLVLAASCTAMMLGCSSSDTACGDGGCLDAGLFYDTLPASDAAVSWGLSRGASKFKITSVKDVVDPCMTAPGMVINDDIDVNYNDTTMTVAVGKNVGTPAMAFFGSGVVGANKATLTRENDTGVGGTSTCTWHEKDVSTFELYFHDKFTLAVKQDQSNFSAGCKNEVPPPPASGKCTSTWTWSIEKPQ